MAGMYYWVGADGNIWLKGGDGSVTNAGQAIPGHTDSTSFGMYTTDNNGTRTITPIVATRIEDPNPPQVTTPAPTGGGGGGTPLNQTAVDNTQRAIDLLPGLLSEALNSEATNYGNVKSGFDTQEQTQRGTYGKSSETNQLNYDSAFMDAIRSGIKGLSGLFALLRGTGASGGTADQQVRNMVGGTTASDIRGGADTRDTNQQSLDSALSSFLTDLGLKRQEARDTYANNQASVRHDSYSNLQDLYQKMAGYYSSAGNTSAADSWLNKAGDLTPKIAENSNKQVSKYDTSPVVVHAPNLTAFQAPTQPSVVTSPNTGQIGSGIFTIGSNRRKAADPQTQTLQTAAAGA